MTRKFLIRVREQRVGGKINPATGRVISRGALDQGCFPFPLHGHGDARGHQWIGPTL